MTFSPGDDIMFMPGEVRPDKASHWRRGEFKGVVNPETEVVLVRLSGDPFDICTYAKQIRPTTAKEKDMPTATKVKPKAKELRREAKALGVEGWEDMGIDELVDAIDEAKKAERKTAKKTTAKKSTARKAAPVDEEDDEDEDDEEDDDEDEEDDEEEDETPTRTAKKSTAKKAAAKKTTAKKAAPAKKATKAAVKTTTKKATAKKSSDDDEAEGPNPYAYGTNLYWMAEALIKGGKVSTLVKNLRKKVEINPRSREYDDDSLNAELQRRLIIVSQHLRNDFGFEMEKEGRGWDAVIRCYKDE